MRNVRLCKYRRPCLDTDYQIDFLKNLIFNTFLPERTELFLSVLLMKQKQCVILQTSTFSQKELFCDIYSCSANLIDKYATNFIKYEPCNRLCSHTWDHLFNRIIAFKSTYIILNAVFSCCNLSYISSTLPRKNHL